MLQMFKYIQERRLEIANNVAMNVIPSIHSLFEVQNDYEVRISSCSSDKLYISQKNFSVYGWILKK